MSYGKIHSSILNSSVWQEPYSVRVVWVAIIATRDRDGYIFGSMRGLARSFGVTVDEMRSAMDVLTSPDDDSQSTTEDGRRLIERVIGGRKCWEVVNHEYYRRLESAEERREKDAERKRKARSSSAAQVRGQSAGVRRRPQASENVQNIQSVSKCPVSDTDTDTDTDTTTPLPPTVEQQSPLKIPCPSDLRLTDRQRATLEAAMVPGWAITAVTTDFVASATADETDKRQLVHWRKCLSKSVSGRWNDPAKRPLKPADDPMSPSELAARKAKRAAEDEQFRKREQAKLIASAKARGEELPPYPASAKARRAAITSTKAGK